MITRNIALKVAYRLAFQSMARDWAESEVSTTISEASGVRTLQTSFAGHCPTDGDRQTQRQTRVHETWGDEIKTVSLNIDRAATEKNGTRQNEINGTHTVYIYNSMCCDN